MIKKLSLLLAAVASLAFAAPSMASASAVTFPAGTLLAKGSALEFTGSDIILTSSTLGDITCASLNFNGTLDQNDGTSVDGTSSAQVPTQAGCKAPPGTVTWTSVTLTTLESTTSGAGDIDIDAKVDVGPIVCNVTGVSVPFTYAAGGDTIVFTKAAGFTAAGCGTIKLDGTFTIETKVSGVQHAVVLD